jgi:hypothetical protein
MSGGDLVRDPFVCDDVVSRTQLSAGVRLSPAHTNAHHRGGDPHLGFDELNNLFAGDATLQKSVIALLKTHAHTLSSKGDSRAPRKLVLCV